MAHLALWDLAREDLTFQMRLIDIDSLRRKEGIEVLVVAFEEELAPNYGGRIGMDFTKWLVANGIHARYQRAESPPPAGSPGPLPPDFFKHLAIVVLEAYLLPIAAYLTGRYLYEHSRLKNTKREISELFPYSLQIIEPDRKWRMFSGCIEGIIRKLNDAYRLDRSIKFCLVCGNYEPAYSRYCCKCRSSTFSSLIE